MKTDVQLSSNISNEKQSCLGKTCDIDESTEPDVRFHISSEIARYVLEISSFSAHQKPEICLRMLEVWLCCDVTHSLPSYPHTPPAPASAWQRILFQ